MFRKRIPAGRLLLLVGLVLLAAGAVTLATTNRAQATSSYMSSFRSAYPQAAGSTIDSCALCHPAGGYNLNAYAQAYANAGHNYQAIENADSDGDGYTNLQEINAKTFPADPNSKPGAVPTPTRTSVPPTATRTAVPPTATATRTSVPPTATRTAVPPTATRTAVPPSATPTRTPPPGVTPTRTSVPPTATPTRTAVPPGPTATATRTAVPPGPTATPTRTAVPPTVTPVPSTTPRLMFTGTVTRLPGTRGQIGNWRVAGRTVVVVSSTWIVNRDHLSTNAQVWVYGTRRGDGSVSALYIRVLAGSGGGGDD